MKSLIILVLALANAGAVPSKGIKSRSLIAPEGRIAKGQDAALGQFPYQVNMALRDKNSKLYWCGGSLIGRKWVLTAAHCLVNMTGGIVALGSINRMAGRILYDVTEDNFIIHNYNPDTHDNDIGLIEIPLTTYTSYIQPVELPALSTSYSTYDSKIVTITGWGLTNNLPDSYSPVLQFARFTIIPNVVCRPIFNITADKICTPSTNGVNICGGDSGGPLVLDSSKIQIGIVSIADENCLNTYPSFHTRVTSYLAWIKSHTGISYYN